MPDHHCEFCEAQPCIFRSDAELYLCKACYEDWRYCQRKGKPDPEP